MKDGHFVAAVWVIVNQQGHPIARGQEWRRVDEAGCMFTQAEDLAIETYQHVRFPWVHVKGDRCHVYVAVYEVGVAEDYIAEMYLIAAVGHPMHEMDTDQLDLTYLSPSA